MIKTQGLKHNYGGDREIVFPDISCGPSDKLMILGNSGTGKTTLLHILGGMLSPTHGTVSVDGQNIYSLAKSQLDKQRGQKIGVIFQQSHFIESLSVYENIALSLKLCGKDSDKSRIEDLLDGLNIFHKRDRKTSQLSQGEKQRVAIARALIKNPALVLADEPTSALDDTNCEEVLNLLSEQAKERNAALILVTHDNRLKDFFEQKIILS